MAAFMLDPGGSGPLSKLSGANAGDVTAQAATNTGQVVIPAAQMATPTGVRFKAPDLAAYDQRYAQSLAASRAGIGNQVQRALEDITAHEGIANQLIGTMPGRFDQIYGQAQQRATDTGNTLAAAAQGQGLGGLLSADALAAPQRSALAGSLAAFQATQPLTQLGTQELFTRQRGGLEQARLGAEADLDASDREWLARRMGLDVDVTGQENQFNLAQQQEAAEASRFNAQQRGEESRFSRSQAAESQRAEKDRSMTDYQRATLGLQERELNAKLAQPTDVQAEAQSILKTTGKGISADKGRALLELGQADTVRNSDPYKSLQKWVQDKIRQDPQWYAKDPDRARGELSMRAKPNWDRSVSVLLAELDSGGLIPGMAPVQRGGGGGALSSIGNFLRRGALGGLG